MNVIAVNICLLPDKPMQEAAIRVSKKLNGKLLLANDRTVPHITLDMGLIKKEDLSDLSNILSAFSRIFMTFNLSASQFTLREVTGEEVFCSYSVIPSEELMVLQSETAREFKSFKQSSGLSTKCFSEKFPAEALSLEWARNHSEVLKETGYDPHITLGFGDPPAQIFPIPFKANKIALYKMGNYCSCQELLFDQELEDLEGSI